ncbi:hypothetical protein QBC43DRAFT_303308 [Cladorrhinum sp. PSN259]|nr:hypothetical protein QBC43DRAFT_303308 [Cladorrhinum sp. PSN259]
MTTPYQDTTATTTEPETKEPRTSTSGTTLNDQPIDQPKRKPETPARYLYVDRVAPPNPNYVPKPPSRLSKFMSKFQSPAVKSTKAKKKAEEDEEKRTGIRTYTPIGAPSGGSQWTADAVGGL